ncbi:MAG: pallilysin-related adhesin [Treponema sp.]|jgi:hypothetical protein|nr:pallilysin-related adhesin [Treponema sp.]
MGNKVFNILTPLVFAGVALVIVLLRFYPSLFEPSEKHSAVKQAAAIFPLGLIGLEGDDGSRAGLPPADEAGAAQQTALGEGETLVTSFTQDFDGDQHEEQVIAYRNFQEPGNPVYVALLAFDPQAGGYRRVWSLPTPIERPDTVSLSAQDMIGDRVPCILASGMTGAGERSLLVLRRDEGAGNHAFTAIADLRIDGSITVRETERTRAYQQGLAAGQSFVIAAYGRDTGSPNVLDQVEITYAYDPQAGRYAQRSLTRVPGVQIEQQRVRELLGGRPRVFEEFAAGLWYYVSPQGTLDSRQYIFFDPAAREIIFYGEDIQQVFHWQSSSSTRYGLYISCQNISVTTLRRFIDIELVSLESIKIRVVEDVRLKINVSDSWDGSYKKAGARAPGKDQGDEPFSPFREAVYNSAFGALRFSSGGIYELSAGGEARQGRYAFFRLDGRELLELRPGVKGLERETYLVAREPEALTLTRVRLGTGGMEETLEPPLSLAGE